MIKKLKSEISTSIKSKKINVFVLFLLFAFIILLFTKLSKEYTITMAFEIEKLNVPEDNVVLNDSVVLDITLKTHGFKWLKYYLSKPKIKVDFNTDVYKKGSEFVWDISTSYLNNTQFDKQVELLTINPDTLIFKYDVNLVKKIPVTLNAKVEFFPGYNTTNALVLEPDSIVVIGPHALVSKIKFLETESVVFDNIKADLSEQVVLKLPEEKENLKFSKKSITIKAKVEKFTEGVLKLPVEVVNVPKGISLNYFPKDVSVSYYVSLSNFKSISSKDFKVVCDYKKTSKNQSILIPELVEFPKGIKNAKINQQRIEFIIAK